MPLRKPGQSAPVLSACMLILLAILSFPAATSAVPQNQQSVANYHSNATAKADLTLLKDQYNLSDEEVTTLESLPPVCHSDLPGLANQKQTQNQYKQNQLKRSRQKGHKSITPASAEQQIWRENELAGHRDAVKEIIRYQSADGGMLNPHANAQVSYDGPDFKDGKDPHLEVFSRTAFPSAQECATCHQQIYDEWATSSHAYSAISPMFHAFENTINKFASGTLGYFCLRCHAPVATTMGLRRDQAIWDGPKVFKEGVTCVACHRVKTPYVKTNGERRIEPGDIHEPVYGASDGKNVEVASKYSDYFKTKTSADSKKIGQSMHRRAIQFEELSKSTFCMSCHQVAVQPGIKLEVVWDQYRASPAYREGVTCQDCHMGKVPGVDAGYSVGPSAIVGERVVEPERKHSNHSFYGPGYSIAHPGVFPHSKDGDRWKFNDWLEFDWRAGWGTDEFEDELPEDSDHLFPTPWQNVDDRYDARDVVDANLKKLEYKRDLRRQLLENGSKLDGPFFTTPRQIGRSLNFEYCLTNLNPGHNMPSGSLGAQPQVWLNIVLIAPDGKRIWETGYVDSNGDLADIHSSDVQNRRIAFDSQLMNLQTKFLTTNVKGTDREMLLPIPVDADQLPFIRPAPQPVTVLNHPPTIRMEGHSLPPLGSRTAKFSVPKRLMQQPGQYRLTARMRSRAEPIYFMRYCSATPEMERMMNEWISDFHAYSVTFEVN